MSRIFDYLLGSAALLAVVGLLGWLLFRVVKKNSDPARMAFKTILSAVLVTLVVLFIRSTTGHLGGGLVQDTGTALLITGTLAALGIVLSVMWTPHIADVIFGPLTDLFDGGNRQPDHKPYYSMAIAKRKRGQPLEAVVELRKQLAKFPNDFEGVMLLASVQAEELQDLPGAEITLQNFSQSQAATPKLVVAAQTQLADWYLKLMVDVDSARAALQKIIERYPHTEQALQAEQRIAHLVGVGKNLLGMYDRQTITVPVGFQNIGLLDSTEFLQPQEIEPGQLAAAHVKHLAEHTHDSEVREKLATIYARDFKRLDLATLELMQLINETRHSSKQIAGWLNLLANFQIELGADVATVRATLEQIVERFPALPLAEVTKRRLARINSELKGQEQPSAGIKMGVYEQNLGLKYGRPKG
jgi:tetratricopeptide (TPR) repeat protein